MTRGANRRIAPILASASPEVGDRQSKAPGTQTFVATDNVELPTGTCVEPLLFVVQCDMTVAPVMTNRLDPHEAGGVMATTPVTPPVNTMRSPTPTRAKRSPQSVMPVPENRLHQPESTPEA